MYSDASDVTHTSGKSKGSGVGAKHKEEEEEEKKTEGMQLHVFHYHIISQMPIIEKSGITEILFRR